jgi:protein-tyrosine phosphatase
LLPQLLIPLSSRLDYSALDEEHVGSIISLMALSREKNSESDNPRIVHCSAGVGRTGTFIALEFLVGELESGHWEDWDVEEHKDREYVFLADSSILKPSELRVY